MTPAPDRFAAIRTGWRATAIVEPALDGYIDVLSADRRYYMRVHDRGWVRRGDAVNIAVAAQIGTFKSIDAAHTALVAAEPWPGCREFAQ